ncbi:unnamed protein product [Sympodiomycopsis kandeliae]
MTWKRLITFIAAEDHETYSGEPTNDDQDIGLAYHRGERIQARILSSSTPSPLDLNAQVSDVIKTVKVLLPPLNASQVGTIRCLGANYVQPDQESAPHAAKANRPKIPILFYKPLTCLSGPEKEISIPAAAKLDGDETDYEVELGVVIGKTALNVSPEEALSHVLGYTLTNDVSSRKRMFAVGQWGLGKSFNGYLPIGPVLVNPLTLPNPENVQLQTILNDETVQNGNTEMHLWTVAETISELSQGTTLLPGTLISMGTPPGEGFKRKPQKWLRHGDQVVVKGDQGLGSLFNRVRDHDKELSQPNQFKAKL